MSTPSGPTIIDAHVTLREAQDLLIKANEDLKLAPDDPSKQAALEAAQGKVDAALNDLGDAVTDPTKIQVLPDGFPEPPTSGGGRKRSKKSRRRSKKSRRRSKKSRRGKGRK